MIDKIIDSMNMYIFKRNLYNVSFLDRKYFLYGSIYRIIIKNGIVSYIHDTKLNQTLLGDIE